MTAHRWPTAFLPDPRSQIARHVVENLRVEADVPLVDPLPIRFGADDDLLPVLAEEANDDARAIAEVGRAVAGRRSPARAS